MPMKPGHPCAHRGCPAVIPAGQRYCDEHKADARAHDQRRASASRRGYGARWRKLRNLVLAEEPLCRDPFGVHKAAGRVEPATDVDHIVPRAQGGTDARENLQGLCHVCHSRKTALEDGGFGNSLYYPVLYEGINATIVMVCGAPGSGKTTFVELNKAKDDIVFDLDQIIMELTNTPIYQSREPSVLETAFQERNKRLEALQGKEITETIWFVVSAAKTKDRNKWKRLLNPVRTYIIKPDMNTCVDRVLADWRRSEIMGQHTKAISRWFAHFDLQPGETVIADSHTVVDIHRGPGVRRGM